jgi:HPt (histidine-containing phosphotransfer) domain-containing protein
MGSVGQPDIAGALRQLWIKFLPQIEERIAVLQEANRALELGDLSSEQRESAGSAAHKLAGVLGTFGMADGTDLAREAEHAYSTDGTANAETVIRLQGITQQLSEMVNSHK